MRFGVLGPLAVWTSEGKPVRVPEVKVRALLADLLLHEGRAVSAERLLDDLWGERLPGNPGNTLQTKVSQLRRALEAGEPGARHQVAHRPPGYALLAEPGAVDVQRFRALTAQARDAPGPRERAALLADALALWRGPALADFADEPFAAGAVRRLEEERLAAVEEQAEARLALGEHAALTGELADLVARHPLRERLRGLQMRALYRAGRQSAALDSFAQLRALLVDEVGLEPGPELTALQRAILAQDPTLDGPPAVRTNIAPQLTELVGRHDDVREVRARLGAARLVTLTGPGGVGKTRLAIETARRLADAADGVSGGAWLVELAGIEQHVCPESECPAAVWLVEVVAAALGVRDSPAGPVPSGAQADLVERVGDALRAEEVLLVLDNCEQVADPVAEPRPTAAAGRAAAADPRHQQGASRRTRRGALARAAARAARPGRRASRPCARRAPCGCSRRGPPRRHPGSSSTSTPRPPSPRSAGGSTASRSRWSWPPVVYGHSGCTSCWLDWTTGSG